MDCDRKCCGCIPLEFGIQLFGCIELAGSIVMIITICIQMGNNSYGGNLLLFGSLLAASLIQGIAAPLLLIGVAQRNRYYLVPWLVCLVISLLIVFGGGIAPIVGIQIFAMIPLGIVICNWMQVFKLFKVFTIEEENRVNVEAGGRAINTKPKSSETASAPPAYPGTS